MRRFFFGILIGFLAAAVAAWAAVQIELPKRASRVMLVLDDLGEVVFGSKPAKVEITNLGEASGGQTSYVVVDANGTLVGDVVPPGSHPFATQAGVYVAREQNGVQYVVNVKPFGIGRDHEALFFEASGCTGQPL